ncbi:MAG: hypothetical protein FJY85_05470 [Deltaproteobacteria bacterium]|nr:hypothetical protein [Deltaproteobacteria bacterium]
MVERGSVTLIFPGVKEVTLQENEMLVIPPSVPHGVRVGPEGATAVDLFSPIRKDFIEKTSTYLPRPQGPAEPQGAEASKGLSEAQKCARLHGFLVAGGINVPLENLKEIPVDVVARYVYERECITMGQLREILGVDKNQAKELLRTWKHGDDHSESSLRRKMERLVRLPRD